MTSERAVQPTLGELMSRYLQQQAQAQGGGVSLVGVCGEVTPYEAGPVQPVDPQLAWEETRAVLPLYKGGAANLKPPPSWPQLVAGQEPIVALPLALGNFPQLVRHFHLLLHQESSLELPVASRRPIAAPELLDWAEQVVAKKAFPQVLLAVGALRLARQWDTAAEVSARCAADVPASWRSAWDNEQAALAWQCGQRAAALSQWQALDDSLPVLFNRGLAALFLQRPAEARPSLTQAIAQLPETLGWHHLGKLYLAMAEKM